MSETEQIINTTNTILLNCETEEEINENCKRIREEAEENLNTAVAIQPCNKRPKVFKNASIFHVLGYLNCISSKLDAGTESFFSSQARHGAVPGSSKDITVQLDRVILDKKKLLAELGHLLVQAYDETKDFNHGPEQESTSSSDVV